MTEKPFSNQSIFDKLKIDLNSVPIEQLPDYTAVQYYLTVEDEPLATASDEVKLRRYKEAAHHLRKVKDFAALQILLVEVPGLTLADEPRSVQGF